MQLLGRLGLKGRAYRVLQWHLRPSTTADGSCIRPSLREEARSGQSEGGGTHLEALRVRLKLWEVESAQRQAGLCGVRRCCRTRVLWEARLPALPGISRVWQRKDAHDGSTGEKEIYLMQYICRIYWLGKSRAREHTTPRAVDEARYKYHLIEDGKVPSPTRPKSSVSHAQLG